jgi:hypothetical protein
LTGGSCSTEPLSHTMIAPQFGQFIIEMWVR